MTELEKKLLNALVQARAALGPFADFGFPIRSGPDHLVITQGSAMAKRQLTLGDCRQAAKVANLVDSVVDEAVRGGATIG